MALATPDMFFPVKDDNPTQLRPVVTIGLIAVNTLVYVLNNLRLDEIGVGLFSFAYGIIPYEVTHLEEVSTAVALRALKGWGGAGVEFGGADELSFPIMATPFTSMFMHGGFMHLFGNMLYLWIYGNNIEDYFGHLRFLLFYLVGGLAAVALHITVSPNSLVPLVGASGAISAVLGAYIVLYPRARVLVVYFLFFMLQSAWLPAYVVLGFYFVIQIFNALLGLGASGDGGVAWMAHLGGFGFGWVLLRLISRRRNRWRDQSDGTVVAQ